MSTSPGCLDEERGDILLTAASVRSAAFRRLLSGRVASLSEIAAETRLSESSVRETVEKVASFGMAALDGATVVAMDGLTTRRTRHCITLDGVDLCTWCAYDIVGIAAALGVDATGSTPCGFCGRTIEVDIRNGAPRETRIVGWLPEETCANVMAEFCPSALFFCSTEHLEAWRLRTRPGSGEALDLRALAERGRDEWGQLVASPSR